MRRLLLLMFLSLCLQVVLSAQDADKEKLPTKKGKEDLSLKGIIYNKEFTFGVGIHTRGFQMTGTYGILHKYYLTRFFQFDLATLKHPRERRETKDFVSSLANSARAYTFGKQNSFYAIRAGYGEKRYLSEKQKTKGIAVAVNYMAGFSLGITKPYYIDVAVDNRTVEAIRYTGDNADLFLNPNLIVGASGVGLGWGEIRPVPGGFAKAGLLFDWGAFDEMAKSLELGLAVDAYPKRIPLMVNTQNPFIFVNLYLTLHLGKRW